MEGSNASADRQSPPMKTAEDGEMPKGVAFIEVRQRGGGEWITEEEETEEREAYIKIRCEPKSPMTIGKIRQSCMRAGQNLLRLPCVTTVDCETFSLTCSCRCTAGQSVATVVNAIREVFREQGDAWRTVPVPRDPTMVRMRVTAEATQQQLKALCPGNESVALLLPAREGDSFAIFAVNISGHPCEPPLLTGTICSECLTVTIRLCIGAALNGTRLPGEELKAGLQWCMPNQTVNVVRRFEDDIRRTTPAMLQACTRKWPRNATRWGCKCHEAEAPEQPAKGRRPRLPQLTPEQVNKRKKYLKMWSTHPEVKRYLEMCAITGEKPFELPDPEDATISKRQWETRVGLLLECARGFGVRGDRMSGTRDCAR